MQEELIQASFGVCAHWQGREGLDSLANCMQVYMFGAWSSVIHCPTPACRDSADVSESLIA